MKTLNAQPTFFFDPQTMATTPEEASEYLSRTNFKSVIEWMTAEAILNRPDDPVTFCRNLLDMKIEARGSNPFAPEQVSKKKKKKVYNV